VGLLVGVASKSASFFGVVNELAGACLVVTMLLAVACTGAGATASR